LMLHFIILFIFLPTVPLFLCMFPLPPRATLFPYTTLFRSQLGLRALGSHVLLGDLALDVLGLAILVAGDDTVLEALHPERCHHRSEEHTSELQSRFDLVCRLLLEKKKTDLIGFDR